MAIGVDTSKRKPRQLRGTPANRFANLMGIGIIAFGFVSGVYFHYSQYSLKFRKASEAFYEDPIEEIERRQLIASGLKLRTGDRIRKNEEEEARPDRPDA